MYVSVRLTVRVDQDIDLSTSASLFSNIFFYILHLNFVDKNQATFNFSVFHQKCHLSELGETDPFLPTFHCFFRQEKKLRLWNDPIYDHMPYENTLQGIALT